MIVVKAKLQANFPQLWNLSLLILPFVSCSSLVMKRRACKTRYSVFAANTSTCGRRIGWFRYWNASSYNHSSFLLLSFRESVRSAALSVHNLYINVSSANARLVTFRGARFRNWMQQCSPLRKRVNISPYIFMASLHHVLLGLESIYWVVFHNVSVKWNVWEESTSRSYSSWPSFARTASCHSRHLGGCWQVAPSPPEVGE